MPMLLFINVVIEVSTEGVRTLNKESPQIADQGETDSEVIDAVYYSFSLTFNSRHINRTAKFIVLYPPTHSVRVCDNCNRSSYQAGCPSD